MTLVFQVVKEQLLNWHLIFRLAIYDVKANNQMNYFGVLWQFINPLSQVGIYWFVFGLGIRQGQPVGDVPYFIWFLVGLIPWFFIGPTITKASNSIYSKITLVTKMKFPVSVLPMITIIGNSFNFFIMLFLIGILLLIYNIFPGVYLLQLPYYIICVFFFLFSVTLLSSTISIMVRDFQLALQSMIRVMFFILPILWDTSTLPNHIETLLKINPIFYLIEGFRNTLLGQDWFFHDLAYTIYFWAVNLLILFIGASIHVKFKHKFVDYL